MMSSNETFVEVVVPLEVTMLHYFRNLRFISRYGKLEYVLFEGEKIHFKIIPVEESSAAFIPTDEVDIEYAPIGNQIYNDCDELRSISLITFHFTSGLLVICIGISATHSCIGRRGMHN